MKTGTGRPNLTLSDPELLEQERRDAQRLIIAMDTDDAAHTGLSLEEWQALPPRERDRLAEEWQDSKFAGDQHLTLQEYRTRYRQEFEAEERSGGVPLWLRNIYAAENPFPVVCEYLALLLEGQTAHGERLKEIQQAIDARTGQGLIRDSFPPFEESARRLREEVERLGLGELFREAEVLQREAKQ